jgi:hypothetical protein
MMSYPKKLNLLPSQWKMCQFDGCGKQFDSFVGLEKHLTSKTAHGVPGDELKAHWIHGLTLDERRFKSAGGRGPNTTEAGPQPDVNEFAHIGVTWKPDGTIDEETFQCTGCGEHLKKGSCQKHMLNCFGLEFPITSGWLSVKDGWLLKKSETLTPTYVESHLLFTNAALLHGIGKEQAQGNLDEDCCYKPPKCTQRL